MFPKDLGEQVFELAKSFNDVQSKAYRDGYKQGYAKGQIDGLAEGKRIAFKVIDNTK